KFLQWQFFRQWQALKQYCHDRGIRLIGDLPIYVAHDSADVWGHLALFALDDTGQPMEVAGVPPDYFSTTGQRWETRCIAGTLWLTRAMHGGLHGCEPFWSSWISCAWTTFVVSKATMSSQPMRLRPYKEHGVKVLATVSLPPCAKCWGAYHL